MRLGDIMSEAIETIATSAGLDEARQKMKQQEIRHLLVTLGGAVVGVVSERDLGRAKGTGAGRTVGEVMSSPLVTAEPRTNVRDAANLLRGHHIGCLPIFDAGRPVGMVTVSDLLDLIGKGVDRAPAGSRHWDEKHHGKKRREYTLGR